MVFDNKNIEDISFINKIANNIRGLGLDMIDNANSGHPGLVLGAANIITNIYANMKIDQANSNWINRDRFILSAGHGSALLYATLFMAGYNLTLEDLKSFRKLDSVVPGHPEYGMTPGVDSTTGPLGEGIATAVGTAIGECYLRSLFGPDIINYNTYVLCGDGDLMEGISYEACSLAGKLGLNKLIVFYDSNGVTLDNKLDKTFNENIEQRFTSMNWNYILVSDSEDELAINNAIEKAKTSTKPTLIEVKTIIGKYSVNENTPKVHGSPLAKEDITSIKEKLGLRDIEFTVSQDAKDYFTNLIIEHNREAIEKWNNLYNSLDEETKNLLDKVINNKLPMEINNIVYEAPEDKLDATRNVSGKILNGIALENKLIIGGSADTSNSTKAKIINTLDFDNENISGRNINFGIRENAMAAIANGIALTGLTPFVSTFLAFSDYLKPGLRLSALMDLPVIYIFSHDSISVGEDGPTHEPIEQLISLRATPNIDVYRPADANEVIGSYKAILNNRKPAALILGRNKVRIEEDTSAKEVEKGAYIVKKEFNKLDATIIATGEEVELALDVYNVLIEKGYGIRIVSMPSIEVFERQDEEYKKEILGDNIFVIEAGSSYSWYKYTSKDHMFTIDTFGASGPRKDVLNKFGFTKEIISEKIENTIK